MENIRLVEMTLTDLFNSTKAFHGRRVFAASGVSILEVRYDLLPENSLLVKATVQGSEDTYTTIIKFSDVNLKGRTNIETPDGVKKIAKIKPENNNAEVYCECPFFKWAFNTQNERVGALYDPSVYIRTEQPIGSPRGISPNPTGVPGLCKHLIALSTYLQTQRIISSF